MAGAPAVAYGESIQIGSILCSSETTGLTCEDTTTGSSFVLARNTYPLGNG